MLRRTFSAVNRYEPGDDADPNPMETVANVSDIMLVLAVALMVALVGRMGIDMADIKQISQNNLTPIEADIGNPSEQTEADGTGEYEQVGTVYRNKETGEMYVVG